MATINLGTSYLMKIKTKYTGTDGSIKSATRTVSPQKDGQVDYDNSFENLSNIENVLQTYQSITTDTVVSAELYFIEEISVEGGAGTPGSIDAGWAGFQDVKLINSYTDGEDTAKETIKRVATAATELQLRNYGRAVAKLGVNGTTAISGYYTGSSIESAWHNE